MDFEKLEIKEYSYWAVYLHQSQYYLGRVYLWAKRENALDFMEMTNKETEEFFKIGHEINNALQKSFYPDLMNYAILANITPHLHIHFIPRYKKSRKFNGIDFIDKRWGKNYVPYDNEFNVPDEALLKIKNVIVGNLSL